MKAKMGGNTQTYRHEDGMNFNLVTPNIVVGSCLQTPADVDRLLQEGVGSVLCLQEDVNFDYFDLDIKPVIQRCQEVGLKHLRYPLRDFDPQDVRRQMPRVMAFVNKYHDKDTKLYIHCTAGMGRAPAAALAWMHWMEGWHLESAHTHLQSKRACGPKVSAIRQATCDVVMALPLVPTTIGLYGCGTRTSVQIAGLDSGFWKKLDLEFNRKLGRHELVRELPVGRYPYKFVIDGRWTYSLEHPRFRDGDYINNYVEVVHPDTDRAQQARIMDPQQDLTAEERQHMQRHISVLQQELEAEEDGCAIHVVRSYY